MLSFKHDTAAKVWTELASTRVVLSGWNSARPGRQRTGQFSHIRLCPVGRLHVHLVFGWPRLFRSFQHRQKRLSEGTRTLQLSVSKNLTILTARCNWLISGVAQWWLRMLVFGWRTSLPCARSMVDSSVAKLPAMSQPTRRTQPSILIGSVNE